MSATPTPHRMPKRYDQTDVPTDKIERAVDAGRRLGEHETRLEDHSRRLVSLEDITDDHERRLASGDVGFAELRKDVANLTGKVGELTDTIKGAVRWVLGSVGAVVVTAAAWIVAHGFHP